MEASKCTNDRASEITRGRAARDDDRPWLVQRRIIAVGSCITCHGINTLIAASVVGGMRGPRIGIVLNGKGRATLSRLRCSVSSSRWIRACWNWRGGIPTRMEMADRREKSGRWKISDRLSPDTFYRCKTFLIKIQWSRWIEISLIFVIAQWFILKVT